MASLDTTAGSARVLSRRTKPFRLSVREQSDVDAQRLRPGRFATLAPRGRPRLLRRGMRRSGMRSPSSPLATALPRPGHSRPAHRRVRLVLLVRSGHLDRASRRAAEDSSWLSGERGLLPGTFAQQDPDASVHRHLGCVVERQPLRRGRLAVYHAADGWRPPAKRAAPPSTPTSGRRRPSSIRSALISARQVAAGSASTIAARLETSKTGSRRRPAASSRSTAAASVDD